MKRTTFVLSKFITIIIVNHSFFFLFLFDFINGSRSNRMCSRFCWSHGNKIVISDTHTLLWFDDATPTSILYTGRWVALPQPTIDCFGIGSVLVRMLCNCTIYFFFCVFNFIHIFNQLIFYFEKLAGVLLMSILIRWIADSWVFCLRKRFSELRNRKIQKVS